MKLYAIFLSAFLLPILLFAQGKPIPIAHAHNDYLHKKPLFDALNQGFTSIEIDVYYRKERLIVSHLPTFLGLKPSLGKSYLLPLKKHLETHHGQAFPNDSTQLVLMIDLKDGGDEIHAALKKELSVLDEFLSVYDHQNGSVKHGAIRVVLSGARDERWVRNDQNSYFQLDGRIGREDDLAKNSNLMPRISQNYNKLFSWNGKGEMPADEKEKLGKLVEVAHQHGKKIRLWASPDEPAAWKTLIEAGVDWVNVDKLSDFNEFYWEQR